jgi:hypothetical protein
VAAPAHHHARNHGARHVEQALDVGVDHLFPVLNLAHVELVQAAAQAGVVDQNVDLGPLRRQLVDGVCCTARGSRTSRSMEWTAAAPLQRARGDFCQLSGAAGGQQQARSLRLQR